MSIHEKNQIDWSEASGQSDDSGSLGGATGEVHFRYKDAMSTDPRDDQLSPAETTRLLSAHEAAQKARVDRQKQARKERQAQKEGRVTLRAAHTGAGLRAGVGVGSRSSFKTHPISQKAQFSGMDRQIVPDINLNKRDINDERRSEVENRLENRNELRLQNAPRYTPTIRPPGM